MDSQYKKRKGESWWAEQIAAQERSKLTQRGFCAERGIVMSSFSRWRARLRSDGRVNGSAAVEAPVGFVEVEVPG